MAAKKTRIAIVGYGNVGRGVRAAIAANSDMRLQGIISRNPERVRAELPDVPIFRADDEKRWRARLKADVAILCGGSAEDLPDQGPYFARFFCTVDSFDTHADIPDYYKKMNAVARRAGTACIISTGWDPGTFSLERVLADAFFPGASQYTFWGRGVSQGHSDAARRVQGVKDARQYTIPIKSAIDEVRSGSRPRLAARAKHKRRVYVVPAPGADYESIAHAIKTMPKYYADYETEVIFITANEMKRSHAAYPHAGFVLSSSQTGRGNKALIEYRCEWDSNPEATGGILVAHARAAHRLRRERRTGAFTILDLPAAYFSPRSARDLLANFV
ncbi:MAG: diaminopimelate dehydrogenase [Vicinamibacteria bacterium]|nr:diaminopimelate dehydrogenase [Vicinamibacteria bacterium]